MSILKSLNNRSVLIRSFVKVTIFQGKQLSLLVLPVSFSSQFLATNRLYLVLVSLLPASVTSILRKLSLSGITQWKRRPNGSALAELLCSRGIFDGRRTRTCLPFLRTTGAQEISFQKIYSGGASRRCSNFLFDDFRFI